MSLKVIYAGTPQFSVAALQAIYQSQHEVIAVYTQPDRRSGRGKKVTASPVKEFSLQHDITVFQPESFKNPETIEELKSLNADVMVVTAYGLILPKAVLNAFPFGCINIHASLLPRWRGAAPIQRAIQAGDQKTGITIMQMDEGLDTGDILLTRELDITSSTNGESLHDDLMNLATDPVIEVLNRIENKQLQPQQQNNDASTYAHKMSKQEGFIDWKRDALDIDRKIRAFYPWPGTVAQKQEQSIKIIAAQVSKTHLDSEQAGYVIQHDQKGLLVNCGKGSLLISQLQIPGKKPIKAKELAHSKNWTGEQFDLMG